jgi:glucokinase-like ROK family protein
MAALTLHVRRPMTDRDTPANQLLDLTKPISPAVNQMRVLHLLRTRGALSRADIARYTNLTKATASRIISELLSRNLAREVGIGTLRRGRRPILYDFNTASAIALGIEVHQKECQAVVTELDATPLRSYALPLPDTRVSTLLDVLERLVDTVHQEFAQSLVGIGIGIPGIYDDQREMVVLAERLEWTHVELARMIRERLNLNVYIINRANAAALGEKWYGAGRGCDDLVFINVGSGIKAGLIVGGTLFSGSNGSAGEIGHMTIALDGPVCVCGKRGCLEALASTTAIVERVKALTRAGKALTAPGRQAAAVEALTRQDVLAAAHAGDPDVLEVFREAGTYIGIAVANLINIFNPRRVILGGLVSQAPAAFLSAIKRAAEAHAFGIPWQAADIVIADLGPDAVAIGAAALLLSAYLQPSSSPLSIAVSEFLPVAQAHLA